MNQRASHEKLKAQIEAAKQGLANWPIEPPANDVAIAVITPAHTNDADNGNNEFGFQFSIAFYLPDLHYYYLQLIYVCRKQCEQS